MRRVVRNRWIIVVLALLAASAFALSVQAGMWWSVGEVGIGPFGSSHCFGEECRGSGLSWLAGSDLWMRSGVATGFASLLSMVMLVVLAAGVAARRIPKLAARATLVSLATTLAVGLYFIGAFPGLAGASIDRGVILFGIANVLGIASTIAVLRARPATKAA
jgi:hypothetical protein